VPCNAVAGFLACQVLRTMLRTGELYVCDGYYGRDYKLFDELVRHGCDFVIRLADNAVYGVEQARRRVKRI